MNPEARSRIDAITSLRFFAAFFVVIFHLEPRWLNFGTSPLGEWVATVIHSGYVSVGFFFILSGFILAYHYGDRSGIHVNRKKFWVARFSRVYPVFLLSLLIGFLPAMMALLRAEPNWRGGLKLGLYSLMNLFLVNGWYPPSSILNFPGWSLSAEAFFYFVFPWTASKIWRIELKFLGSFMLLAAAVSVLIPCLAFFLMPELKVTMGALDDNSTMPAFILDLLGNNPLIRSSEFILGVAAGRHFLSRPPGRSKGYGRVLACMFASCLVVISASKVIPSLLLRNGLLDLPFVAIIYFTAKDKGNWSRVLSYSPLILLGEASYALYILHVPFRDLNLALIRRFEFAARIPGTAWFFIFLAGIIPVSILVTLKIEEPCRKWLNRRCLGDRQGSLVVQFEKGAV